jgi:hypothetical protein
MYRKIVTLIPRSAKVSIKKILRKLRDYFNLYVLRKQPIIVFQMGKVGSVSVHKSLEAHGHWVFHTHAVDPKTLDHEFEITSITRWIFRHIVKRRVPTKYITMVREPIGTVVSAFFHNLEYFSGEKNSHEKLNIAELQALFFTRSRRRPLIWFDRHLKSTLGIDVYETPFPHAKGYLQITQDHIELLILRTEADDATKEQAICEFLGLKTFKLKNANIGEQKEYGAAYREFKRTLVMPHSFVDTYCDAEYTRHFYTEEEIAHLKSRWLRNTIESPSPK